MSYRTRLALLIFSAFAAFLCGYLMAYYRIQAHRYKEMADERARSLRVADRALTELVRDRAECTKDTVLMEQKLQEASLALNICAETTTKKIYLKQVERNCTIASNRLVRLAKNQKEVL